MKNNLLLLIVLCLPLFVSFAGAQEIIRNEEGRSIVVFPDGKWKYYEQDSTRGGDLAKASVFTPEDPQLQANRKRYEAAKNFEKQLALELIRVRLEIVTIEQELTGLQERGREAPLQTNIFTEARLRKALARQEELLKNYELAKNRTLLLEQIIFYPADIYAKKLAGWEKEHSKGNSSVTASGSQNPRYTEKKYRNYDPSADVLLNPPVIPCQVQFEGKDASGSLRRDMKPGIIFTRTDPGLREHFQQNDFIVGQGYLTKISGGIRVFTLEVIVATQRAPELFGVFRHRDFIELQLLDGNVLRLFNNLNDPGQWNPTARAYVYRAQYLLGMKDEKMLRSSELDLVHIRWSKVQEEFLVYELDFFKRQFECLDSLKGL